MAKAKEEKKTAIFDRSKKYSVEDAIKLSRELSKAKFDQSVELHANLGIDPKKGEEQVRGTVALPHGTGKSVRIAAFVQGAAEKEAKDAGANIVGGEDLISEIKTKGKIDFDVAITTPDMMPKIAALAKILGPKGLMPSPKNETVTTKIKSTIEGLKKGKIVFKNDDTANVHVAVGKLSFDDAKLTENINEFLTILKKSKPASSKGVFIKNLVLSTSMGPGIKLEA
ncbi:MAG: 50S ribosomal protein L1 [Patescibacteria group bacterium]